MKYIFLKSVAAGLLLFGLASCADELNIHSIDPKSSPTYDVKALLAKQYATLGLTGQQGPAGNGDLQGQDEGESGFYRTIFNLQEMCSDEVAWAWQTDTDVPNITNIAWTSSSTRCNWAYQRLAYDITLYNQFISEQSASLDEDVIAEVRFLRALNYYYFLDLFHKAPFKDTYNTELPAQLEGKALYDWLDKELTDIEGKLKPIGAYNNAANFGRADKGAALALHAQLALNSVVYTDGQTDDYRKCKEYCDEIINSGAYALSATAKNGYSGYEQVFMGDNDENGQAMKEIIFPIRQDGRNTREYSGSTMLVSSMRIAGMPYSGTSNYWSCYFSRKNLVEKFFPNGDIPMAASDATAAKDADDAIAKDAAAGISTRDVIAKAGDDRALFYMGTGGGIRTLSPGRQITGFLNGASIVKWQNLRSDNSNPHDGSYSDTDIPLLRLGTIYLTRAEAEWRLGQNDAALADIQTLQRRANRSVLSTSADEQTIIDEWARECYTEGRRRSDLVRFGYFTGSRYLWDFKGGQAGGTGVDSHYNVYPIPATDLASNPNMTQNKGY